MTLAEFLSKSNMNLAYEQVTGNRGAAGVDGIGVNDFAEQIKSEWTLIKNQLESGSYQPKAVKRVEIPKAIGGVRLLGIPTYMDRLIQQAISQVLVKVYDPEFSATSYCFRSEKNAHQAMEKSREYINFGYSHVVDLDLSQFFDRVNHDYLMNELSKKIVDKNLLKLIHRILRAKISVGGNEMACKQGVPQGAL